MQWNDLFATRTRQMKRSAVREILKLTTQPDMISFAGGLPAPELFPVEEVRRATETILREVPRHCLQYGETEGLADLRDEVARRFAVQRENVCIVTGGQQGLDLIGRVLVDPEDRVLVENPTYLALLTAWRPYGAAFCGVPCDVHGMRVDALEALLKAGRPKLIYSVPTFQNPQGTTLSLPRRQQLVALLHRHGIGLLEDDAYGELRYSGRALPRLITLDAEAGGGHVIHVGTFSKVLMPGLRVGWVVAPVAVIDKLVQAKQAADLHTASLSQYLVLQLIREGLLETHVSRLCEAYRERRDLMLATMERHFPAEAQWTRPDGGMFLMVTLPERADSAAILKDALAHKVAFVPGEEFFLDGRGRNTFRLNFSNARPAQIEEGIARLGAVLKAALA